MSRLTILDADQVRAGLSYPRAIEVVREAMAAFSRGETRQPLRSILPLGEGRLFGVMPGALGEGRGFGAKLVSVYPEGLRHGRDSHQGVVVLFDPSTGAPSAIADAGEITAIRTGAASAAATEALATPDAAHLALYGCGRQAMSHGRAIACVRTLKSVRVWGRSHDKAEAFARAFQAELGVPAVAAATGEAAAEGADILCTVTAASEPVLKGAWVSPGAHVNVVGSSYAGPVEVDDDLVLRSRFFADSREGVLAQGAEFLKAKAAGLVGDDHIAGEIGAVYAGLIPGRRSPGEITVYKSLGHIAQDLASVEALLA